MFRLFRLVPFQMSGGTVTALDNRFLRKMGRSALHTRWKSDKGLRAVKQCALELLDGKAHPAPTRHSNLEARRTTLD